MRTLTVIANSLDARMLRDILALEGLHVKLAAASAHERQDGAVALLIADHEFERAQSTLARWLADHPAATPPAGNDNPA
ncbi:hypothetical protein [Methyloversatilis sp.]|uniref:hypothetical protein n=1 Tax=Methyloversatilis sp. TaxID=2569862 RepID=UPI0035B478AD